MVLLGEQVWDVVNLPPEFFAISLWILEGLHQGLVRYPSLTRVGRWQTVQGPSALGCQSSSLVTDHHVHLLEGHGATDPSGQF